MLIELSDAALATAATACRALAYQEGERAKKMGEPGDAWTDRAGRAAVCSLGREARDVSQEVNHRWPLDSRDSVGRRFALICLVMLAEGVPHASHGGSLTPCPGCELLIGIGTTFSATFSTFERSDGLVLPVTLELDGSRWELGAFRFATAQRAPALPVPVRAANPYWGFTAMRRWAVSHRGRTKLYLGFGANYRSEVDYLEATRWNFAYLVGVRLELDDRELELGARHWSDAWIRPPNRGETFLTLSFGF